MEDVNWTYLGKAIDFYVGHGFKYIEVPWTVPMSTMLITCPHEDFVFQLTDNNGLVGSAEQSFLYLTQNGQLPKGKYVGCSPCFRREPNIDFWHQTQFMKVELFDTLQVDLETDVYEQQMVNIAIEFFETFGIETNQQQELIDTEWSSSALDRVYTNIGTDIELMGIELGSYGTRSYKGISWTYGTGLAEPRFSSVLRTVLKEKLSN